MMLKLFKLVFNILLYIHCAGCTWFYVVNTKNPVWIPPTDFMFLSTTLFDESTMFQYWNSFYYAVLMLNGNELAPRTVS